MSVNIRILFLTGNVSLEVSEHTLAASLDGNADPPLATTKTTLDDFRGQNCWAKIDRRWERVSVESWEREAKRLRTLVAQRS